MAVKGVFASDQNIIGNRKGDFASALIQTMPTGTAPFFALTSGMQSSDAMDTVVTWFEENHISGRIQVTSSGGINSSTTTLPVIDASSIPAGTILLAEATGEMLFITGVSSNSLTIVRGFGGTTAASIANSAFLQRIGTAFEEGSSKPTAVANLGFPRFNYCQIFRNTWNVTGTAQSVQYYTGNLVAKNKQDAALFHAEDIERSILFGVKSVGVLNGAPFRTMDGINTQITTNVTTAQSTTTWSQLETFIQGVFQRNIKNKPNERIAFCGNTALSVINGIARSTSGISKMNLEPGQTDFGLKINKWYTPFGDITLMTHPLMVESPFWSANLYLYHPGAVELRYLRRTMNDDYDNNGQRAGVDADYGVITTELSVMYKAELTGGQLLQLVAAA